MNIYKEMLNQEEQAIRDKNRAKNKKKAAPGSLRLIDLVYILLIVGSICAFPIVVAELFKWYVK